MKSTSRAMCSAVLFRRGRAWFLEINPVGSSPILNEIILTPRPTAKPISCCVQKLSLNPTVWMARNVTHVEQGALDLALPFKRWVNVFVSYKAANSIWNKTILQTGRFIFILGYVANQKAELGRPLPVAQAQC